MLEPLPETNQPTVQHSQTSQAAAPPQVPPAPPATAASEFAPVEAPAKGRGRAYTIDNLLGYRKEDTPDGKGRQIRFADRPGGRKPEDELLHHVREQKPHVSWSAKEKAWQARNTPEGRNAIDAADQDLADLGSNRARGRDR